MRNRQGYERNRRSEREGEPTSVYEAGLLLGWVVPISEADVLRAERDLAANPVSPLEQLRDLKSVFDQAKRRVPQARMSAFCSENPQVGAALARAAREAGRLTPEVEERMRCDRKAAEEEQKKDGHGKDVR
jgi:hypothetical protein